MSDLSISKQSEPGGVGSVNKERRGELLQKFGALASLFALIIVFATTSQAFMSMGNGMSVALQVTSIAFLGLGATAVIITGGIDLSVGSVLALAGVADALAIKAGASIPLGILVGLTVGGICGAINGLFITRLKLPPFIATLGMMLVARGFALRLTDAQPVSGLGQGFATLGNGTLFRIERMGDDGFPNVIFPGIPYPVVIMIVLAVGLWLVLSRTRLGRHIYAVGSNAEAARLSGVNVARVTLFTYVLSGVLAGLTGCVLMSRLVTAQPNEGVMYELDAIASAVIGGTSLSGGIGSVSGTVIGAFTIGILRNGLNMLGVSSFTQQIIIGVVILLTVCIDQLRNRKS
ncbi:ABC transporter permease [Pseudomonas abietaniphila]|uniref:Monosaccharide ABC transporter membrane protein, CUT2 family n=1 Tax=Pseudomonas abietaniphila TaxID=89065 RepID=A0A1G8EG35_9PSED|nr:ABC transporter permease [Pseudomonas abietaniphila]SDH68858.1 monosaccharide ABC transporter membrane protein, CUT2 family [Pseudomonas abietaniphila]